MILSVLSANVSPIRGGGTLVKFFAMTRLVVMMMLNASGIAMPSDVLAAANWLPAAVITTTEQCQHIDVSACVQYQPNTTEAIPGTVRLVLDWNAW
jgi:hypothetical protein